MEPRVPWGTTCRLLAPNHGSLYTQSHPAVYKHLEDEDGSRACPEAHSPRRIGGLTFLPSHRDPPRPKGTVQSLLTSHPYSDACRMFK